MAPKSERSSQDDKSKMRTLKDVQWVRQWGWNMFALALGTAATGVAISTIPYPYHGQTALSVIFLLMAVVFWILNVVMTSLRLIRHPKTFHQSFLNQTEGPWVGVALMSLSPMLTITIQQGVPRTGPWLIVAVEVIFYIYMATAFVISWTLQSTFRRVPRTLAQCTATDLYEILPFILGGVFGSTLVSHLVTISPSRAFTMYLFSLILAGLSFWVAVLKLAVWMVHHMTLAHAPATMVPTYMTAAAPFGFTGLVMINLAKATPTIFAENNAFSGLGLNPEIAAHGFAMAELWFTFFVMGYYAWVVLSWFPWGMAHLVNNFYHRRVGNYAMTCWSWTFPTLGFIAGFGQLAKVMPSKAFGILSIIGTFYLFFAWVFNICGTIDLLFIKCSPPGTEEEFDHDQYKDMLAGDWEPIRDHRILNKELDELRRRVDNMSNSSEA